MTSAYILILVVLVLGGLIATLGDRLGTKVGKARLSLFKLRPKQTATVVTIITGIMISATTLGVLFASSESLRKGVFQLDEILKQRRRAVRELTEVSAEKDQIEQELVRARSEQTEAQKQLDGINQFLKEAIDRQARTAKKLEETQQNIERLQRDFRAAQTELKTFSAQAQKLRLEIKQLQTEREELLAQREQVQAQIAQRDQEIAARDKQLQQRTGELQQRTGELKERDRELQQRTGELKERDRQLQERTKQLQNREQELQERDRQIQSRDEQLALQEEKLQQRDIDIQSRDKAIAEREQELTQKNATIQERDQEILERENRLKDLEKQQAFLEENVQILERNFQVLREGNFAILRNQVLAFGVVRILDPAASAKAVEEILQKANQAAIELIRPGASTGEEKVVQITETEVEQLIDKIDDGKDYVVRILAAANYLVGERYVQVFADVAVNTVIFKPGEVLAATSLQPDKMNQEEVKERLDLLLAAARFRSKRAGIIGEAIQIGDGSLPSLLEFIEQLARLDKRTIVQAITADVTYTAGPMKLELVAIQDGQIILRTR
ncbi:MAG TPA: DUF3084 domain-containing protein [Oscillatoriaceae cyanobacterium M33_DOE_052]|uniref:DUF3084 domain-containing protein n=1 Tax=Planktothricoides sp. SpSt-374 TaxID=2282167 RepID=A0A7C3VG43_9CYAN|nr:DUF3084 domain-containing protein [Oscillatoriaceae cyanobacterium M33_DOE_052]